MKIQSNITEIIKNAQNFFTQLDGTIIDKFTKEYIVKNELYNVLYMFVEFHNNNILGRKEFCNGVFSRYRWIMKLLNNYLCNNGFSEILAENRIIIDMIPFLSKNSFKGNEYKLEDNQMKNNSPMEIVNIDDYNLREKIVYIKDIPEVKTVLRRVNDGKVYILEELSLLILNVAGNIIKKVESAVDIGAGSGNYARLIMSRLTPKKMLLNDADTSVCNSLSVMLKNDSQNSNTTISIKNGDCIDLKLPKSIDLLTISVNPDVIITFFNKKKNLLKKIMSENSLLIIFAGEVWTTFTNLLLTGYEPRLKQWPWNANITSVKDLFSNFRVLRAQNEVVIIASKKYELLEKIVSKLPSEIVDYRPFE